MECDSTRSIIVCLVKLGASFIKSDAGKGGERRRGGKVGWWLVRANWRVNETFIEGEWAKTGVKRETSLSDFSDFTSR